MASTADTSVHLAPESDVAKDVTATPAPQPVDPRAVHHLLPKESDKFLDTLTAAFEDDPVVGYLIGSQMGQAPREGRLAIIRSLMAVEHALSWKVDGLKEKEHAEQGAAWMFTNEGVTGGLLMFPPGKAEASIWDDLQAGALEVFKKASVLTTLDLMRYQGKLAKLHPPFPHYYVFAIGTLPEMRGKGIGTALMKGPLEQADSEGLWVYLENSKEKNLPFYQSLGFITCRVLQVGGFPLYLMLRPPKGNKEWKGGPFCSASP